MKLRPSCLECGGDIAERPAGGIAASGLHIHPYRPGGVPLGPRQRGPQRGRRLMAKSPYACNNCGHPSYMHDDNSEGKRHPGRCQGGPRIWPCSCRYHEPGGAEGGG